MSTTANTNRPTSSGLGPNTTKQSTTATQQQVKVPAAGAAAAAPSVQHAENYDEAPPGVPGPDYSARDTFRQQAKPVFNRGPSMLDFTAVTSAGPTPAAADMPPSASYFDGSRRRESHLPDDDDDQQQEDRLRQQGQQGRERMRRQTVTETDSELPRRVPGDEVRGVDAFAPVTSRQETDEGPRDGTNGLTGANDTFGGHT